MTLMQLKTTPLLLWLKHAETLSKILSASFESYGVYVASASNT